MVTAPVRGFLWRSGAPQKGAGSQPSSQQHQAIGATGTWALSESRSVCHSWPTHACHGDATLKEFSSMTPGAFDKCDPAGGPELLCVVAVKPESEEVSASR